MIKSVKVFPFSFLKIITINANPLHKYAKWPPSDLTSWTLTLIKGQDILGTPELWQKVLVLIPDEKIRTKLHTDFATLKDSEQRWSR